MTASELAARVLVRASRALHLGQAPAARPVGSR
jgi:hypothetical protein